MDNLITGQPPAGTIPPWARNAHHATQNMAHGDSRPRHMVTVAVWDGEVFAEARVRGAARVTACMQAFNGWPLADIQKYASTGALRASLAGLMAQVMTKHASLHRIATLDMDASQMRNIARAACQPDQRAVPAMALAMSALLSACATLEQIDAEGQHGIELAEPIHNCQEAMQALRSIADVPAVLKSTA